MTGLGMPGCLASMAKTIATTSPLALNWRDWMAKLLKPANTKPSAPCAPRWPTTIRLHTSGATNTLRRAANKTRALVLIGHIYNNTWVGRRQDFPTRDPAGTPCTAPTRFFLTHKTVAAMQNRCEICTGPHFFNASPHKSSARNASVMAHL